MITEQEKEFLEQAFKKHDEEAPWVSSLWSFEAGWEACKEFYETSCSS